MSDKNIACKDMILELQDMTYLDWTAEKTMSGTPGCFAKVYEEARGKRVYYKLSNYDHERGIFGYECVNELIVSRLMDVLGIPHADYKLNPLREEAREYIFDHIEEALSEKHIHKLWEMIWKRWLHFEQIRNKKNKWE